MASPNPENDSSSMFLQKTEKSSKSPTRSEPSSRRNSTVKTPSAEHITVKDFFDFMKTAYQVYEHLEGENDDGPSINWEEITKLTIINHVIEHQEKDLLYQTAYTQQKNIISKSDMFIERKIAEKDKSLVKQFSSCSEIEDQLRNRRRSLPLEAKVEMLGVWTEANLNCKLNDVFNEGILDSILPYLVGYKKATKTTSLYTPIIKKPPSSGNDIKKPASFGAFVSERDSRDRLGRRKSSIAAAQERANQRQDGEVEIHVCDEVKGLKKDFRCPQKLLVSKMGYFADVTAGQRLEDMDISVHCDIQIFDWLMRWVKRDSILVADWPLLEPGNVIPILVSASFLQMDPLLQDCLAYCHAHMSDVVKTSTNLACLSDTLITRLAAMYTNAELEAIKDRKDKIQSRLYCKMILSLAEPVPETLRGHYATLATLFKCNKCNKLLGRHIAEQVPCQPASMRIDQRGNVISSHIKDTAWSLNEYITWLYGELRSWRRVYWRLWGDCHFLKCQLCDNYFPAYQMEWCSHHEQPAHMFGLEGRPPLPVGRYPCCGERAYRFETLTRSTGCQFREHAPDERLAVDSAIVGVYTQFKDIIAMKPPQLIFPERVTRLVAREGGDDNRLQGKEVFWWDGIQLTPPRQPLGLLGKLYTSNTKFNPNARPGSPVLPATAQGSIMSVSTGTSASPERREHKEVLTIRPIVQTVAVAATECEGSLKAKKGIVLTGGACTAGAGDDGSEDSGGESSDTSESSERSSEASEEEAPPKNRGPRTTAGRTATPKKRGGRTCGRQWVSSQSARSNQDGQRRFEERALRQMKTALGRRAPSAHQIRHKTPTGGVYARLEAEWREKYAAPRAARGVQSARQRQQQTVKYK